MNRTIVCLSFSWWKRRIDFGTVEQVPGLASWAASVQAAVTAIRKAGATTQMILLPGTFSPLLSIGRTANRITRQRLHRCLDLRIRRLRRRSR